LPTELQSPLFPYTTLFRSRSSVKYKYAQRAGDLDTLALIEDVLFVFECKNSLHPCSPFELRTSFDHLVEAQDQLDRTTSAVRTRSEEHTSELQSPYDLVCR